MFPNRWVSLALAIAAALPLRVSAYPKSDEDDDETCDIDYTPDAHYGGSAHHTYAPQASDFGAKVAPTGRPGHLAGDLAAAGDNSSSSSNKPSPELIALLAINGSSSLASSSSARSTSASAAPPRAASGDPTFTAPTKLSQYEDKEAHAAASAEDEMPLTHGPPHGPYYDPHDPASNPPSRPQSRMR
ncbi:hypothetical protein B0H12DRAFT_1242057 [Mycena haematopus]|nr:hypothetical protein B0H12DRAFT_1242057 [Mycena haematopus]